ncbi:MAG: aldehyde dehydrogenase family protein [Acidimicrobiales bacterium]|nr:aldehyde dehydrogenase family protein [Acidimicrobiales bacterium]MCB9393403.1 aldehyde dehydrogenase family protein [Acidimicrobiaceae bacterium]
MSVQRVISPIDGAVVAERPVATPEQVEEVLRRADAARVAWAATSLAERAVMVERAVAWMLDHADEVGLEMTLQMGRAVRHTPMEIRRGFQERARMLSTLAPAALADLPASPKDGFQRFIRREPVGTVLVVAPWNYPYLTSINAIAPALLAGNTVVLKHATQTILCAERYSAAFEAAGLPEGVFQHVHADHESIARMIRDPRIGFVAFTGSVEGGHAIQAAASTRFIGTGLELGGKDPSYVRADADLELAIAENVDGAFFNAGQSCCSIERIYVHESVFDDFVDGVRAETRSYVLGDPRDETTTIGPMVTAKAAAFVRQQIDEALAGGATAITSEADFAASQVGTPYLGPTVLIGVDHSMSVMRDESFGPVVGIVKVSSDDEAVALMNDSPYGLSASVWSRDVEAAIALGDRVETGTWYLNRCDYLDPELAWTGVKDTGHGISLSPLGFEAVTRVKSFHLKLPN